MDLFKIIWPSVISIFILMVSRSSVYTILTYVPAVGMEQAAFTQILVFINLGCDLGGRFLTIVLPNFPLKKAPFIILGAALFQLIFVNIILLYVFGHEIIPPVNLAAQITIGGFALLTGFFQTSAYAYAPLDLPMEIRPQVAALMNVATQAGNYVGLTLSFTLQSTVAAI